MKSGGESFFVIGFLASGSLMIEAMKNKTQSPYENCQTEVNSLALIVAQNGTVLNLRSKYMVNYHSGNPYGNKQAKPNATSVFVIKHNIRRWCS